MAIWATAASSTSCCRRRSRPSLASASSLCRLEAATASPSHRRRRRLELGRWRGWPAGPRRPAEPAAAEEGRGFCRAARRHCVGGMRPQPCHHRRWQCLELGWWRLWPVGPRRQAAPALLPKNVKALAGQRVVAVSAGNKHSIAITADGAVYTSHHFSWYITPPSPVP